MAQLNDLSRSLVPLEPHGTLVAVIEMSQSSWLGQKAQAREMYGKEPRYRLIGRLERVSLLRRPPGAGLLRASMACNRYWLRDSPHPVCLHAATRGPNAGGRIACKTDSRTARQSRVDGSVSRQPASRRPRRRDRARLPLRPTPLPLLSAGYRSGSRDGRGAWRARPHRLSPAEQQLRRWRDLDLTVDQKQDVAPTRGPGAGPAGHRHPRAGRRDPPRHHRPSFLLLRKIILE